LHCSTERIEIHWTFLTLLFRMHRLQIFTLHVILLLFTVKLKTVAARYELAAQYAHRWPYNLPVDAKFWPEDGPVRRRDLKSPSSEPARVPVGVRKMSGDEGEKFYTGYWIFDGPGMLGERPMLQPLESKTVLRPRDDGDDKALQLYNNASTPHPFKSPILPHTNDYDQTPLNRRSPRAALLALQNRDFQCPGGTTDCSSIGRPNSCCADGEVCQIIPNTGLGDVGCCPVGKGCSGDLKNCDLGFTKCSDDLGGGCCIPEYVCVGAGCEFERFLWFILT
jgi:progranulin